MVTVALVALFVGFTLGLATGGVLGAAKCNTCTERCSHIHRHVGRHVDYVG